MNHTLEEKEKLVESFISIISEIDYKARDEIENNLYRIVYDMRGLLYRDLK